jgi:alkanesulfonate monooxygenase SsuD/methylene tetrahydromethanopterin reductase-like flavin-dependent oxidoreductase (luciferase family)
MDIGIALPSMIPGVQKDVILEWAHKADASPFDSLGATDRLVWDAYESLVALTAAAALTHRVKLITHILISPLRSTGILAKQVASLDALSGGRVILGLGVGGREDDFLAAPANIHRRGRIMEQQLQAFKRVWSGQSIAEGVGPIGPPPGRPGGPPILMGGRNPAPLRRAGQIADGYIAGTGNNPQPVLDAYRVVEEAWKQAGRPGRPLMAAISFYALGEEALRAGEAYLGRYYGPRIPQILSTPQAIKDVVKAYQDIGMDDYVIMPTAATLDQFDRLADVVA